MRLKRIALILEALALLAWAGASLATATAPVADPPIQLNTGWIYPASMPPPEAPREPFAGKRLYLVQFSGPIQPEWYAGLEQTGCRVVVYIPTDAYLIYGDAQALAKLDQFSATATAVRWRGPYLDGYKVHPDARPVDGKGNARKLSSDRFSIQLVEDPQANAATLQLIDQLKLAPVLSQWSLLGYLNATVRLPAEALDALAAQPEVVSIQLAPDPVKMDERQDMILAGSLSGNGPSGPGYLTQLATWGFTQAQFTSSGFGVDVTDSGVDDATPASPNHFGLYLGGDPAGTSRLVYSRLEGTPNTGSTLQGCDGHGTLNTHIVAGYVPTAAPFDAAPHVDASGFHYGLGVAPFVKVGSSVIFDPASFTSPSYPNLQSKAYNDGMRISTNSWGASVGGAYNSDSQAYDALVRDAQPAGSTYPTAGNQEMVIVFSAGNSGSGANTIGSPGTAKNVITSGASEGVQAFGGADQCSIADTDADSANDVVWFSSRGPCDDGRIKPDFTAPGSHISGGVFQAAKVSPVSGTGAAAACFNASGVCGGPSASPNFWPGGQQWYTASSGTSHSCPAMAGGCALVRQYFLNQGWAAPSPAMTKAYLMNSTRYMTGTGANDNLYSNNQGMGMMDLGRAFDGTTRVLRDQIGAEMFTASGQTRTFTGAVSDNTKPFRVTLAWTDAPGATSGNAYNNDLNLSVTAGGTTYLGNVFTGASSTTGGAADPRNNVESVFVPAGVTGNYVVTVTAANINSDGVPNVGGSLDQDFALVVYNATAAILPVIGTAGASLTAEGCAPANGVPDPSETVTYSLSLQNVGTGDTADLVATLQATGGVTSPSGPQTYGVLTAGGSAVAHSFTFTVDPALTCGGVVTATLALQDGAASLGTVTFALPTGLPVVGVAENFDGVTAPAIPAGWTVSLGSGSTNFVTGTLYADTAPNAAFGADPATANDARLDSPSFFVSSASAPLTFRHRYALESGFDGAVLEISIGGGAFQDILAAGGSFTSGGYTGTISSSFGNPLGGRSAWTGTLASFSTVSVTLPGAAVGQNVVLRWRVASDSSLGAAGWFVDTLSVVNGTACCGVVVPPSLAANGATLTAETCAPANGVIDPGETVTFDLGLKNVGLGASTDLVATLQATGGVLSPSGPQTYGALAGGGGAATRPFTFTVDPATPCGGTVTVTLALQDGALNLGTVTYTLTSGVLVAGAPAPFSNAASITIPSSGAASPFPSPIAVSGLTGTVAKVTATLTNLSHTYPDDVDVLLVGPAGQKMSLMQNAGSGTDLVNVTLTFDDAAATSLPDASVITSGTYKPSQYGTAPTYPSPAPSGPYGTALSVFNGTDPNGTWNLFVFDDASGDSGSIAGGWSLAVTTQSPVCCVCPTITLSPATLPNGQVGAAYNQTLSASGGTAPYTFAVTAGALPGGLTLAADGTLSGTPTAVGTFPFTVTATATGGCAGLQVYSLTVETPPDLSVTKTDTPDPVPAGQNLTYSIVVANAGPGEASSVSLSDPLPPGTLFVSATSPAGWTVTTPAVGANGTVTASRATYAAAASDTFDVVVQVPLSAIGSTLTNTATVSASTTDPNPANNTATTTTAVVCPTITLTPTTLPDALAGAPYSQALTAAPAGTTYTYAVSAGALPPGMTLSSAGLLNGTPTHSGPYTFTVTATGWGTCTGSQAYTLTVTCPSITVNPATLPGGVVGAPYSVTFTATGGLGGYTYAVTSGTLPPGLSLSASGALTGTLGASGSYSFTATATDSAGCTGSRTYALDLSAFDLSFLDDAGATQLCLNTYSGTYAFTIFSGTGAGTYAGLCTVAPGRLGMMVVTSYGSRTMLSGTYSPLRHVAQATFTTPGRGSERADGGILVPKVLKATLTDSNTLDDPPCGGGEPAR